jgi:uncharacterized protein (TIGR00369 family)
MSSDFSSNPRSHPRTGIFWDIMEGRRPHPPVAVLLGFELLDADPDAGTIRIRFQTRPEFANPVGNVQGGILAAMLDDALGPALVATLEPEQFAPTIELKVNYIESARIGPPLIASARVVARKRTIAFVAGELRDEAGTLIATATATARIQTIKDRGANAEQG